MPTHSWCVAEASSIISYRPKQSPRTSWGSYRESNAFIMLLAACIFVDSYLLESCFLNQHYYLKKPRALLNLVLFLSRRYANWMYINSKKLPHSATLIYGGIIIHKIWLANLWCQDVILDFIKFLSVFLLEDILRHTMQSRTRSKSSDIILKRRAIKRPSLSGEIESILHREFRFWSTRSWVISIFNKM